MNKEESGKPIGSIIVYEHAVEVKFDAPVEDINRRAFLDICATYERMGKELRWLSSLPDDQIAVWDDMVSRLQQAQYPEPFTIGLYETLLKEKPADDRDKDVA
jgi:hypothetical protein